MRHMKKLAALLLALVMALALAVPAVAAEDVVNETTNRQYRVYQIFAGDQAEDSDALGNVQWGQSVIDPDSILNVLKSHSRFVVDGKSIFAECTTAEQVAAVLAQYSDNSEIARSFATVVTQYMSNECATITDDTTSLELEAGYYLVCQSLYNTGNGAYNSSLLQVTKKGKFTVAEKFSIPTVKKYVKAADGGWNKEASWSIGDDVSFRLVATLSKNYFDYETYNFIFHDALSTAFQYNNDYKVYVKNGDDQTDITSSFVSNTDKICSCNHHIIDCNLRFSCKDLKAIAGVTITENSEIVVEYTAKLLNTASVGGAGNLNETIVEYPVIPTISRTYNAFTKVKDTVMVFTNEFDITKVDGADNSKKLQGAEFKLEKGGKYVIVDSNNKVSGWANTLAAGSTLTSDADGLVKIIGLGEGTYKLHEIKAPAGYNVLTATIGVVITDVTGTDTGTGLPKLNRLTIALDGGDAQDGDVTTGLVTATVENNTGASLPETGGVGTTLFYIIGGMLMVGAAVLLVTRKRMSDAK